MMPDKIVKVGGEIYTEKIISSSITSNLEREITSFLNPIIAEPSEAYLLLEEPLQPRPPSKLKDNLNVKTSVILRTSHLIFASD